MNFQESTTILNACTKTSGNLLKAPRTTTPGLGRPESNTNEGLLHIPQTSKSRATSSDAD